ncbi:MAG: phospholipase D-like domain-containing protein [Acidimicrobiales bacterium]
MRTTTRRRRPRLDHGAAHGPGPSGARWVTRAAALGTGALALLLVACGTTPTATIRAGGGATPTTSGRGTTTSVAGPTTTPTTAGTTTTAGTAAPAGLSLLVEPQAGMTPVYDFMSSARRSLDMTMYELSDPTAEQILIADHDKGVRVRVLLDQAYSGGSVNRAAYSTLSAAGVSVAWANDSGIFHQKTITVDDAESAVLTGNLTSQYYATTRDFAVMDDQAADVTAIETVFASDWAGAAPAPGPAGGDLVWSPGSASPIIALIDSATRSVVVENEEMDSAPVEDALGADARRGVAVTVIMTSDSQWDSAFSGLESAGVRVVLYPDTASALYIHAKAIDVDGARSFIGSENFSAASLDDNRELGLITSSSGVVGPLSTTLFSDALGGRLQSASAPPPTTPATTPPPPTSAGSAACHPIDDEGGCYEPGEYCRDDDHGVTGLAGDGKTIVCEYQDGWYWEP